MSDSFPLYLSMFVVIACVLAVLEPDEISKPVCSTIEHVNCSDIWAAIMGHNFPCQDVTKIEVERDIFVASCGRYRYRVALIGGDYSVSEKD